VLASDHDNKRVADFDVYAAPGINGIGVVLFTGRKIALGGGWRRVKTGHTSGTVGSEKPVNRGFARGYSG